jgi:endogenous inhibitor of DNA gyrase (YacG/DUF329 family)
MDAAPLHPCPICGREAAPPGTEAARIRTANPSFPFCSPRCKMVDLGRWLDGTYAIPGPVIPDGIPPEDDE